MTVARTAADVLSGHVTMEIESVDRMYLNLYVPPLQRELGVVGFFKHHRGQPFASGALMQPITEAFVAAIHRFADLNGIEFYNFKVGQRKDDVALEYLAEFDREEGIMFIGVAQEKTWIWGTRKRRNPDTGAVFPWIAKENRVPNHFYFYSKCNRCDSLPTRRNVIFAGSFNNGLCPLSITDISCTRRIARTTPGTPTGCPAGRPS